MAGYDPLDGDRDPFRPPAIPTLVGCLHCQKEYDSYRIEWRIQHDAQGKPHGFWCCPIPGCNGKGFGFDIFPVDPDYRDERGGWFRDDEGEDAEDEEPFPADAGPQDQSPSDGDEALPW